MDTVICGDAIEVTNTLPDDAIDLAIFSPPYDAIRDYHDRPTFDIGGLAWTLARKVKEGGFLAVVIGQSSRDRAETFTAFEAALQIRDAGWTPFQTIIYARDGRPGAWFSWRFRVDHEYVFVFCKRDRARDGKLYPKPCVDKSALLVPAKHAGKRWAGTIRKTSGQTEHIAAVTQAPMKCPGTIWRVSASNSERNRVKMKHPATMPDDLARRLILAFSRPGATVFDPMAGSFTVPIVALKEQRIGFGCDISPAYCEIGRERLAAET